jgi:putative endonuclease
VTSKTQVGKYAEDNACTYLEKNGYTIITRNFRFSHYEIDIIAKKDNVLCFIEVKFRHAGKQFNPFTGVHFQKQQNITKCAQHFLSVNKQYQNSFSRFDVLFIINSGGTNEITHLKNAFRS